MKNNLRLDKSGFKIYKNTDVKKDLIELLLNGEGKFLEEVIDLDLTKKQYSNFDLSVKNIYEEIGYNYKGNGNYLPNELDSFLYELNLITLSFGDYLLYFAFKTKDEQFGYFYISLFEGSNFLDNEGLSFYNKNEFVKFIKEYVIKKFFNKIEGLSEIKIFIGKNESLRPMNNDNFELEQSVI